MSLLNLLTFLKTELLLLQGYKKIKMCSSRKYPHSLMNAKLLEIPKERRSVSQNVLKESVKLNWNFQRNWFKSRKTIVDVGGGGMDIFLEENKRTQCYIILIIC